MTGLLNSYFHSLLTGWRPLLICVALLAFSGLYFPAGNQDSFSTHVVDDFDTSTIVSNINDDHVEHLVLLQE
jgi:hypothetical protein